MPDATNDPTTQAIGAVLGRVPSGVFILTAADGEGRETGMLASWVQQAGFAPPCVTVAVNQDRYLNSWFQQNPHVVLNLIGENQFQWLKHFGKGFEPDEAAFEDIDVTRTPQGIAILTGALGYLSGSITGQVATSDHTVYVVQIDMAQLDAELAELQPMVHVRKDGFRY
ncbi:MAG: flavin reductase family protein [Planctomycetaceae bacterium]